MTKLPVLICIPHGSTKIPEELQNRIVIEKKDLLDDIDAFTQEIYDLGNKVLGVISADVARTFVDMNRTPEDLPPEQPDGIIKSMTCYECQIYKYGKEPDEKLTQELIEKYYKPYQMKILNAIKDESLKIALDCHSMAEIAPGISPDTGEKRPTICLGNCFEKACSIEITKNLANCFCEAFELDQNEILINKPFYGKYTTQCYGNKPVPWIHVELNRNLFLKEPWWDTESLEIDKNRLHELNQMFENTLKKFFETNTL